MRPFQLIVFISLLFFFPHFINAQTSYKVTAERVNVRNKPSTNALIVGTLNRDETISVMNIRNGWATFIFNGKICYVSTSYIEQVKEPKEVKEIQEKNEEINQSKPTESIEPTVTTIPPIQGPTKTRKKQKKSPVSSNGQLHLIADVFGGYSNFRCDRVSPESGFGFGCDIGIQGDYKRLWNIIPNGFFGEFTVGYSCRGSGAFPLHGISARVLPLGYRYKLNTEWALAGKAGMYFAYPFSGIRTKQRFYDSNFDCGMSIGLGVEWKQFGLMASYEHGFMNVVSSGAQEDLFNQGAFLTISYKFLSFK